MDKLVYFKDYCKTCKHGSLSETEQPCDECLHYPANTDSHEPVKYEEEKK